MATATVYGDGTDYLKLPVPGTVTLVESLAGAFIPDYIVEDGYLVAVDASGVRAGVLGLSPDLSSSGWRAQGAWALGVPYTVTYTPATTVAPTTDEIASLRLLIADADGVLFEDSAVTAALQTNATGGGYDLNGAAADLWRVRAASLAGASAATASVQSESYNGHSTTYAVTGSDSPLAYALKMATYYDGLRVAGAVRSGWVF